MDWQAKYLELKREQEKLISKFDEPIFCIMYRNYDGPYEDRAFTFVELKILTKIELKFLKKFCSVSWDDLKYSYNTKQNYLWSYEKEIEKKDHYFLQISSDQQYWDMHSRPFEITRNHLDEWKISEQDLNFLSRKDLQRDDLDEMMERIFPHLG